MSNNLGRSITKKNVYNNILRELNAIKNRYNIWNDKE